MSNMKPSRVIFVALATGALLLLSAGSAWAPHVAQLNVSPTTVRPGDTVTIVGTRGYGAEQPVDIRLDDIDGPVLATFQTDDQFFAAFGPGEVTIPADVEPGAHVLVATQVLDEEDSHIRGVPARAAIEVVGAGGEPARGAELAAPVEGRPDDLNVDEPASMGSLVLVGLGVAGVAMFLAAMGALLASKRSGPAAERARR